MDVIATLYLVAGLLNTLGLLIFNGFYTNESLTKEPIFMIESQILIHLWGFVYIAASQKYDDLPWINLILSVEKIIYFVFWCIYIPNHANTGNILTDIFYTIYGPVDLIFAVVFAVGSWIAFQKQQQVR